MGVSTRVGHALVNRAVLHLDLPSRKLVDHGVVTPGHGDGEASREGGTGESLQESNADS